MKVPKLTLLIILSVVLAAAAWFVHQRDAGSWQEGDLPAGGAVLPEFDVNAVVAVKLVGPAGTVTLRRGERGWMVEERADYPADFDKISPLIRKISGLAILQSMPVGEGDFGALSLRESGGDVPAEEAGVRVDLLGVEGRVLSSVVLGKVLKTAAPGLSPDVGGSPPAGRYVRAAGAKDSAFVVAETFNDLRTSPALWIDSGYVRPGPTKRIEVSAPDKERSWKLEREKAGAPWKLAGMRKNEALDPAKVVSLDSLLGGMAVADASDGPQDARLKPLQETAVTIVADTFDGLRYTFTVGEGGADNLPVSVAVAEQPETSGTDPSPDQAKARADQLAQEQAFGGKAVFIPRKFFEPFLVARASLLGGASPASPPPPKSQR